MAFASLALTTEGKSDYEALHAMAVNCTRILAGADNTVLSSIVFQSECESFKIVAYCQDILRIKMRRADEKEVVLCRLHAPAAGGTHGMI